MVTSLIERMYAMDKLLTLLACLLVAGPTFGQVTNVVFFDPFEDGVRTNGADAADLEWWRANQNLTLAVAGDTFAGGGSTNALAVDIGGIDAFKRIYANFTATTLGTTVGDKLVLSFDFHAMTTGWDNGNLFRFGLYNSGGTVTNGDLSSTSYETTEANDFGYNARIPFGTATIANLIKEPAGDNTLGGGTAGSTITNGGGTAFSITDTNLHNFALSLVRTNTGIYFTLAVDGVVKETGLDTSGIHTNFDVVYFGSGSLNNFDYRLDNVSLMAVVIPEPSALALVGLGLLGVLALRRRR
jgi:hypothetical protein